MSLSAVLALVSAATFGAADFMGGLATRRASAVATVVVSQIAGVLLLLAVLPVLPSAQLARQDMMWGAAAGLAGGVGLALLYRALSLGAMSVVAPITAVCSAAIPVAAGLASGERLSTITASGIALAGAAIVLLGQVDEAGSPHARDPRRALQSAIASGVAIGIFLVALERTSAAAGLWPLVAARAVSISLFIAIGVSTGTALMLRGRVAWMAIAGGCLDMAANALYLVAVRAGDLSVVATLTSLYPASTVLLARLVLAERLTGRQVIGIAAAVVATVMIVGGSS